MMKYIYLSSCHVKQHVTSVEPVAGSFAAQVNNVPGYKIKFKSFNDIVRESALAKANAAICVPPVTVVPLVS